MLNQMYIHNYREKYPNLSFLVGIMEIPLEYQFIINRFLYQLSEVASDEFPIEIYHMDYDAKTQRFAAYLFSRVEMEHCESLIFKFENILNLASMGQLLNRDEGQQYER